MQPLAWFVKVRTNYEYRARYAEYPGKKTHIFLYIFSTNFCDHLHKIVVITLGAVVFGCVSVDAAHVERAVKVSFALDHVIEVENRDC